MKLKSPHPFPERLLLYGGGGSGKTNTVLNVASHLATGEMHVIDADYSRAYTRALYTDFTEAQNRVHVYEIDPEWVPFHTALAEAAAAGDPETDWLVVDPISPSWEWVQGWYLDTAYGHDLAEHLIHLKTAHSGGDDPEAALKGYQKALLEDMNWPTVKKEYEQRVWRVLQQWKGNMILCAEAKDIGYFDKSDADVSMLYGPIGYKPVGESRIKHIAGTTLFLDHPKRGQWRVTTVKDRNRDELDKETVDDFGLDYLVNVAGWTRARKPRSGTSRRRRKVQEDDE